MYSQLCRSSVRWSLRRLSSEMVSRYQANDLLVRTSSTFQTNSDLRSSMLTAASCGPNHLDSSVTYLHRAERYAEIDLSGVLEVVQEEEEDSRKSEKANYEMYDGKSIPLNPTSGYGKSYLGKHGAFYVGIFENGLKHGRGTIISNLGGKAFKGKFREGKELKGKGQYVYDNGDAFSGVFVNGRKCGPGELVLADGTTYRSSWLGGLMTSACTVRYPSGETFTGAPVSAQPVDGGYARCLNADGSVYAGRWRGGLYHGQGTLYAVDGSLLRGHWAQGQLLGRGVFIDAQGKATTGVWSSGGEMKRDKRLPHPSHAAVEFDCTENTNADAKMEPAAPQTIYHPDGTSYCGELLHNRRHGWGVFTYSDGNVYEGPFRDHKMEGRGTYTNITTGAVYTGQFEDNMRHGAGRLTFPSGDVFTGIFRHNEVDSGEGTYVYHYGSTYTGSYKDGRRHGPGVLRERDGSMLEINFLNNRPHGEGVHTSKDGEQRRELWEIGTLVKQGPLKSDNIRSSGNSTRKSSSEPPSNSSTSPAEATGSIFDALPELSSAVTLHFEDDTVYTGECLRGVPHGRGRVKYRHSGSEFVGYFRHGLKHGLGKQHYKRHRCVYEGEWARGQRHGDGTLTYYDTDEVFTGKFKEGVLLRGTGVYYTSSKVRYEGVFEHGHLVHGAVAYEDGSVYEGALCDGLHHGQGTFTNSEGVVEHDGLWEEGEPVKD